MHNQIFCKCNNKGFLDFYLRTNEQDLFMFSQKYKYGSRNFWCRGYYVDTVGKNKKIISEYIKNQLEEDYVADQMSIKEYTDPFTGSKKM